VLGAGSRRCPGAPVTDDEMDENSVSEMLHHDAQEGRRRQGLTSDRSGRTQKKEATRKERTNANMLDLVFIHMQSIMGRPRASHSVFRVRFAEQHRRRPKGGLLTSAVCFRPDNKQQGVGDTCPVLVATEWWSVVVGCVPDLLI
jgi:hypothetical protein